MQTERYYILDDHKNIKAVDVLTWGKWFDNNERHVGDTMIGEVRVSTVFLGLDHSFATGPHAPILFETMIFGGPLDERMWRYTTMESAKEGHERAVQWATHPETYSEDED
jgi:hypothetical protein